MELHGLESGGEQEIPEQLKESRVFCYVLVFCIDLLIPLMLILSAISAMSCLGILFVILLYLHVILANSVKESITGLRACLGIDFCVNLIVFVVAFVSYFTEFDSEAITIIGLDFNNIISSTPTLNLVTSLIAMICQVICIVMLGNVKVRRLVSMRRTMFGSIVFQFFIHLIWALCNAFNAASNSSYLYLPILIYFVWSNICLSLVGANKTPPFILVIVMAYSLLFAIFELYIVSPIGEKWNPAKALRYVYVAPDSTKSGNVVIAVFFACLSVQQMSAPGLTVGARQVARILTAISDQVIIIAFAAVLFFGLAYPNYLSLPWLVVVIFATFAPMRARRDFFFPLITIVFTVTFTFIVLTSFEMFTPPTSDGTDHKAEFLKVFGFFRYPKDFTFSICGFCIICALGQIGKVAHSRKHSVIPKPPKSTLAEARIAEVSPELIAEAERETILAVINEEKRIARRKRRRQLLNAVMMVLGGIWALINYSAVAAVSVVNITAGFWKVAILIRY
jgi:hypothetical protein